MLVSILMNLGATYQLQNKKKESVNSYINAYEVGIALEHNDPQYINSLIMLGDLECQGSFLQTALQYYQRGLKECLKLINNLKIEYQDLTEKFQELQKQKNFQKDIKYHQITGRQNYLEATIRKAQISLAILYINQGKIFAVQKKKQDSFESINLARDIYRDLKKQSQNSLMHFNQIKSQLSSQERENEQTYLDYLQRQTNVLIGSLDSQEALIQYSLEKDAEYAFQLLTESDQNYKTNENINETDFITHLVNKQKLFAKICVDDKIKSIKIFQQNPQKFYEEIQNTMNQFNKYKTNFNIQQQQGQKQNTSNQDEFNDLKILKLSALFEFYGIIINNYTQQVQDQNQTLQKLLQQYNWFNENEQYSIETQELIEQVLQFKQDYQLTQDLKNLEQTLFIIRQRQEQEATSQL
ncbi:hypothetical protein PPERSA_00414 [Pseudocohnilembus persalinus]|uniref:Tetratricopeptide repeat protein n=1 Tax=Pseudocohnilembus persalinus TaxID=266149 RepID=A0A0V0QY31_PSEPJ|nr:hypothetical protein PPERSA_00414 [Pseudocohnilembus persalinus]|eukprot:KRX07257.1 hypothetical protein PPERSA_00414 [Pseudocohnilembus persalinus]